jgi:hypothetical protein
MEPNTLTADQLAAGVEALKTFVRDTKGFLDEIAIPESVYETGVNEIGNAGNETDGGQALFNAINAAGFTGQANLEQCQAVAGIVLAAIAVEPEAHEPVDAPEPVDPPDEKEDPPND